MCYNTGMNTLGIGNAVPAGSGTAGSGDKFDSCITPKKPKSKKKEKEDWKDRPNIIYLKR